MDTEQYIEMSRVWSLVATDTEDTFSILDFQGNILAEDVLKATFSLLDPTGIKEIKVQGNELSSLVNNVLTLIGVEGKVSRSKKSMRTASASIMTSSRNVCTFLSWFMKNGSRMRAARVTQDDLMYCNSTARNSCLPGLMALGG